MKCVKTGKIGIVFYIYDLAAKVAPFYCSQNVVWSYISRVCPKMAKKPFYTEAKLCFSKAHIFNFLRSEKL